MWDKRAKIIDVHDGDTVTAVLDQGFGDTKQIKVRLFGVFAPELSQPGGPETRQHLEAMLHAEELTGYTWPVIITTARTPRSDVEVETLGRYVATITGLDQTRNINLELAAWITAQGYGGGIGAPA